MCFHLCNFIIYTQDLFSEPIRSKNLIKLIRNSGGSKGGAWEGGGLRLILGKKEEMTEGRRAGWASKIEPAPLLSSKSGCTTVYCLQ